MSIDEGNVYIGGINYSVDDFKELTQEEKIEKMREWFFENYEDPVERTPYESKEGGYIFIWGGPYHAHEELCVFEGFVDDDIIDNLASELSRDCPEWTARESPEDYDKSYFDSVVSGSRYYESFNSSINHIQSIAQSDISGDTKQHLLGLLYVNCITAVEAYLSDAFINKVLEDKIVLRKFIETNPDFKDKTFKLSEIFAKHDSLDQDVKVYLLGLMWHNLKKIKPMYKSTLDVDFPSDLSYMFQSILKRHDLVHRGGKDKDGNEVVITDEDLQILINEATNFVDSVNNQIDRSDFYEF